MRQAASCPNDSGACCHDDMVVVAREAHSMDRFEFKGAIGRRDLSRPISLAAARLEDWLHAFISILQISIAGLTSIERGQATAMQKDHRSLATRQTQRRESKTGLVAHDTYRCSTSWVVVLLCCRGVMSLGFVPRRRGPQVLCGKLSEGTRKTKAWLHLRVEQSRCSRRHKLRRRKTQRQQLIGVAEAKG